MTETWRGERESRRKRKGEGERDWRMIVKDMERDGEKAR